MAADGRRAELEAGRAENAEVGEPTREGSTKGPAQIAARLPMRPMTDLLGWLAERRQAPLPPEPPQTPTFGFFPADFWTKSHPPGPPDPVRCPGRGPDADVGESARPGRDRRTLIQPEYPQLIPASGSVLVDVSSLYTVKKPAECTGYLAPWM